MIASTDVNNLITILGIPVLIWRGLVMVTYRERRTHLVWTMLLPTIAVGLFFVRGAVLRNFDLLHADDWSLTAVLAAIVVTQAIAAAYGWWPTKLFRGSAAHV